MLFSFTAMSGRTKMRIAVDGLTHQHVVGLFNYLSSPGSRFELVGIAETDQRAIERYSEEYSIDKSMFYDSLGDILDKEKVDGVLAFNSISRHIGTIALCAEKGVDVMVEKPLALDYREALEIRSMAEKSGIEVIVNYETTWYPSNSKIKEMLDSDSSLGQVRKIMVNSGHNGPKEINVSDEFLEWLKDPLQNGGGAVIDFGCYGANLSTWIMGGRRPESVTALLQTDKPDVYPLVDDEATIILTYPGAQAVIQGSWNWPFNRKDMEVYCTDAYMKAYDSVHYAERKRGGEEVSVELDPGDIGYANAFDYFADVLDGTVTVSPLDLSSLENNVTVMEILDAAVRSARLSQTVYLR